MGDVLERRGIRNGLGVARLEKQKDKAKRTRCLYVICNVHTGKIFNRLFPRVGNTPEMSPATYPTRKSAESDCPVFGEVVVFKDSK